MDRLSANALVDWNGSFLQTPRPSAESARGVCQEIAAISRQFLEKPGFRLSPGPADPPQRQAEQIGRGAHGLAGEVIEGDALAPATSL
jgi:hypothetical protein